MQTGKNANLDEGALLAWALITCKVTNCPKAQVIRKWVLQCISSNSQNFLCQPIYITVLNGLVECLLLVLCFEWRIQVNNVCGEIIRNKNLWYVAVLLDLWIHIRLLSLEAFLKEILLNWWAVYLKNHSCGLLAIPEEYVWERNLYWLIIWSCSQID